MFLRLIFKLPDSIASKHRLWLPVFNLTEKKNVNFGASLYTLILCFKNHVFSYLSIWFFFAAIYQKYEDADNMLIFKKLPQITKGSVKYLSITCVFFGFTLQEDYVWQWIPLKPKPFPCSSQFSTFMLGYPFKRHGAWGWPPFFLPVCCGCTADIFTSSPVNCLLPKPWFLERTQST